MRISFELKLYPDSVSDAKSKAYESIGKFLNIPTDSVPEMVDMELKVSQVKDKDSSKYLDELEVTAFANVKQSVLKPFGN
jgi:hypothetical protein